MTSTSTLLALANLVIRVYTDFALQIKFPYPTPVNFITQSTDNLYQKHHYSFVEKERGVASKDFPRISQGFTMKWARAYQNLTWAGLSRPRHSFWKSVSQIRQGCLRIWGIKEEGNVFYYGRATSWPTNIQSAEYRVGSDLNVEQTKILIRTRAPSFTQQSHSQDLYEP